MNGDRRDARWTGTDEYRQDDQTGPSWLVIAAVRPWILPVFDRRGGIRGIAAYAAAMSRSGPARMRPMRYCSRTT
jgi:hypothetical protein